MTDPLTLLEALTKQFAARADDYDKAAAFPGQDFDDLFAAGLLAPTVPIEHGGLGLGPRCGDTYTLWAMTRKIAAADLALARCWEGHANSLVLLDALGTPEQRERWFDGVVSRGDKWVAWSGEPRPLGTLVTRADGGWRVRGRKGFATSATGADWAILLVDPAGPGGARHAGSDDTVLMLACDLSDPTVRVDTSWWDPIGMRATVSHAVDFDETFISDDNQIGPPGAYLTQSWQSAFLPHYAASFLGAADALAEYARSSVLRQSKDGDPYVQHRIGSIAVALDSAELWLRHVAALWDEWRVDDARLAGLRARHVVEHLALAVLDDCVRVCGARGLIRPSPVERILRDLTFYVRHDNDDRLLATVGKAVLGREHDVSFGRR
ncbi:acyl-CoA dehydrogenase family protein [Kutzneria sp. NPDC052558]|uniref:acyl-CoA dehydrogenase family protein n=1 Tax=Kutzneria sp. NPDC052558 TaxID=3364121 RepID=UPI0037C56178